ncbi:MAG: 5'-3' exonuclease H3TH domain-containing protein, partial [Patescibacteria group bacterium]
MFMDKLILIDGNAILHRGFHAMPPFTSPDGRLVNAVYGFFSMFLKIIQDFKPSYIVVCFDRPKPTFRKLLYVGYQAKRPKMSDDLVPQIAIVHEILKKAKIEIFEVDGYEADDLIGTLATKAVSGKLDGKLEVVIVSGDRDMLQLINSQVTAAMPITGITNMTVFDERKTEEKYQVKPAQIIDYKSLVGDPSDNYSGVSGIGPKTAVNLLKEFDTLENIYKNLDNIQKKNPNLALKLAEGGESAGLAKKLATIVTDAPITLDIEKCSMFHFDMAGIKEEFEKLSFKSLLKRLEVKKSDLPKEDESEQLGLI